MFVNIFVEKVIFIAEQKYDNKHVIFIINQVYFYCVNKCEYLRGVIKTGKLYVCWKFEKHPQKKP